MATQANSTDINRAISLLNAGNLAQAEILCAQLLSKHAPNFTLQHILSLSLDGQQKFTEAATSYEKAILLQPNNADLHFNIAIIYTHLSEQNQLLNGFEMAKKHYLAAIKINPNFFEAHGNLGTVLQRQGLIVEAIASYQTGLTINPADARGHFNLGTALRDNGDLSAAVHSYLRAIELFPNYTDAHNNVGETFRDMGNMADAVKAYQAALALNPQHARANYNMAEFLVMSANYSQAIDFFEQSQLDDWQERILYCLYKAKQFEAFAQKRDILLSQKPHTSPFLATLCTHYSQNFNVPDPYNFCKNGLDFVYHVSLPELQAGSALHTALLYDIETAKIAERKQGRLTNGQQSAGNLFKRPEASFRQLAEIIKQQFLCYREKFSQADCELINHFPQNPEFASAWYVKMQQGGHLSAHIHEIGWLSGAVYLAMPDAPTGGVEGAFEYGTHGDDYPINQTVQKFATAQILPNVGDIVLFPSSLFHRTIPFNADQPRICIAFDLAPSQIKSSSHY